VWHQSKGLRFTHFMRDVRRLVSSHDDLQYFRGVEPQEREVLHDHLLVRCRTDLLRLLPQLRALAKVHGFGWVDVRPARPGDESYIAKYVSDACDVVHQVAWLDAATGEVMRGARCRTWTASRRWGHSMAEVKRQQRAWVRQAGAGRAGALGVSPAPGAPAIVVAGTRSGPALDPYTGSYPSPPAEGVPCPM